MKYGIGTGVLWAIETIILSIILSKGVFINTPQAIFLAPFVSAFLNDTFSGIWLLAFRKSSRKYRENTVWNTLKKKNGRMLILSGLCGGPLGMSSYLLAIKFIGASYTAVISALFPVFGSIIAWIFLKDKLSKLQVAGICLCSIGVIGMTGTPNNNITNILYFAYAFACALFWGLEAVISSYAMRDESIPFEVALQIRHGTSTICYGILFLPLLHAWGFTLHIFSDIPIILLLLCTALFETGSYLLYYKAISLIGAPKAMALNITYMMWSVLFGIFVFNEIPGKYEVISILILMTGVIFVALYEADKPKPGI